MLERARELAAAESGLAVIVTSRADGTAAASVVNAGRLRREVYAAAVGGRSDDSEAMDETMEAEGHTAVLIRPTRVYSNPGGG